MSKSVIVLGGGGHARVLIDALNKQAINILGVIEKNIALNGDTILGIPVIGDESTVLSFPANNILLVNGLGSVGKDTKRAQLFKKFKERGYTFLEVIHPSLVIAANVVLGEGVQIMAGSIIQTGSWIGDNTIINTRASVDHDCIIGEHVHIAPGVTLSGSVKVGAGVHIGTGSTVIQGISIGENSIIGAGSVVISDIPAGVTAVGVPAREVKL